MSATRFIYNADHTVSVVPVFNHKKRFLRETKINDELLEIEEKKKLFMDTAIMCDIDEPEQKEYYLMEVSRLEEKRKILTDLKTTNYNRRNSRDDGYRLNAKAKRKIRGLGSLVFDYNRSNRKWSEFITLTGTSFIGTPPPIKQQDAILSRCFKKFIDNLRKNHGLSQYLYVVERQKRGMIHYHCIFVWSDKSPKVFNLNLYWLSLLNKEGMTCYSEKYQGQFSKTLNKVLSEHDLSYLLTFSPFYTKNFEKFTVTSEKVKFSKMVLNPLDREEIRSQQGLSKYLTKYMTKSKKKHGESDELDKIYTRVWGASKDLLGCPTCVTIDDVDQFMETADADVEKVYETKKDIHGKLFTFTTLYLKWSVDSGSAYLNKLRSFLYKSLERSLNKYVPDKLLVYPKTIEAYGI